MQNNLIKVEIADHIALVKMDAPPVNAQTRAFVEELTEVFDILNDTPEARVVILTGREKIFSAGATSNRAPRSEARLATTTNTCAARANSPIRSSNAASRSSPPSTVPRSAPVSAQSSPPTSSSPPKTPCSACLEIDIGLMGGARHAMKLFPHSLARRMILTGYRLPAAEAYRRGIIECCVPLEQLMDEAMAMARNIAAKSPAALRLAKRSIQTVEHMPLREGYRFEQNLTVEIAVTRIRRKRCARSWRSARPCSRTRRDADRLERRFRRPVSRRFRRDRRQTSACGIALHAQATAGVRRSRSLVSGPCDGRSGSRRCGPSNMAAWGWMLPNT